MSTNISGSVGSYQTDYEITKDGGATQVGGCEIKVQPRSLAEAKKVTFSLTAKGVKAPDGYVCASLSLSCRPILKLRKHAGIQFPIWFVEKNGKEVELSVCTRLDNSEWKEHDSASLTEENFVDIQIKELSNITVFLSKKFLPDVHVRVMPYLFHKSDGSFKAGFGLSNEVLESQITSEMATAHYTRLVDEMKELILSVGDDICYALKDAKKDETQSNFEGRVTLDETFIGNFSGQVVTLDLKAVPIEPSFCIQHERTEAEGGGVIVETYPFSIWPNHDLEWRASMEFHGNFEADNVMNSVGHVHIDQSTTIGGNPVPAHGEGRPINRRPEIQISNAPGRIATGVPGLVVEAGRSGQRPTVKFMGNTKVKNFINNAGTVTINQRRIVKKSGPGEDNSSPPIKVAVQAENDLPFPNQQDTGAEQDPALLGGMDINEKNDLESMASSGRAFSSTEQAEDQPSRRQL